MPYGFKPNTESIQARYGRDQSQVMVGSKLDTFGIQIRSVIIVGLFRVGYSMEATYGPTQIVLKPVG